MSMRVDPTPPSAADAPELQAAQQRIALLQGEVATLRAQLEWFRRQIFGQKSERYAWQGDGLQMHLGDIFSPPQSTGTGTPTPTPTPQAVAPHQRHKPLRDFAHDGQDIDSFFDASRVAVHTIEVPNPALQGLRPEQYEVVGYKHSHRLAQQSGAYSVLRYRRAVIKRLDIGTLHCPPAPEGVLQGSRADVSLMAGIVVDKIAYYLPLYRQHQRLSDAGFKLSRAWLTQLVQSAARLLAPIYEAQLASVLHSRVLCMDETPIKAGRDAHAGGKMHTGYLWPMLGEQREVCFAYCASREHRHVHELLGRGQRADRILVCDGYQAYASYAQATQITRAQCWVHARREIFNARAAEPQIAHQALALIDALYAIERDIGEHALQGEDKKQHRLTHSKPLVDQFFAFIEARLHSQALLPSNPMTKAMAYAHARRAAMQVFLSEPDVPMDTNAVERAIRPVAIGRRNWNFCWTEMGAQQLGQLHSLVATCRMHQVDPYTYLVDVLQRVGSQPASRVHELTPRLWKQHFASDPLRSDVHAALVQHGAHAESGASGARQR